MFKTRSLSCCLLPLLIIAASLTFSHMAEAASRDCPKNEVYFECGNSCQTECATLNEPCLIRHIRCPDGCYCIDGYARNANGKCIPISKCPKH